MPGWLDGVAIRAALAVALLAFGVLAAGAHASSAGHLSTRTVVLDAVFSPAKSGFRDKAPSGDSVGDQQYAAGSLRDRIGARVGSFAFTCTWIAVQGDVVHERCTGYAALPGGRLRTRGPALRSDASHSWRLVGGTGAYTRARGPVVVHDLGTTESVIVATFTGGAPRLLAGEVGRPAANASFIRRADAVCSKARSALAALPRFPLDQFDPAHPTVDQLVVVGTFFTGAGDPRPALRAELTGLQGLGAPISRKASWNRFVASRADGLSIRQAQDDAANAGDIPAFVASLAAVGRNQHQGAIAAATFGNLGCYPV